MDALQQIRKPIEQDMLRFREEFEARLVHANPLLNYVLATIGKRKGKMMRPILVLLASRLMGEVNENTIYAAAAFEFFHTASLVHDDIVDESDERRGQKSVNNAFGNQVAVLVGDYMLATALFCASKTRNPRLVEVLSIAAQNLASGELLQLSNISNEAVNEQVYFDIIKDKTAALFAACAQGGIMSVSSDEMAMKTMYEFGELLGICFQIRDDIFDYSNDTNIGKPTGNDMKEGKLTLPAIHALLATNDERMMLLARKVKEGGISLAEIDELVAFTKANGGIEYATNKMYEYADKAKSLLDFFPDSEVKQALCTYVDYVVDRNV